MRFNLLTRASQILADKVKATSYNLKDCKIYSEKEWQPYGFIGICVVQDGNFVAAISQDLYSAEAMGDENIREAEKFIINKVNKLYDS